MASDDRRVRRTRRRLKEALLRLLESRDYEAITVREILEEADVGRTTFYEHYRSKEDLLFDGFDRWLHSLIPIASASSGEPERVHFCRPLFEHMGSQRKFFLANLVDAPNNRVRRKVSALLADVFRVHLTRAREAHPSQLAKQEASQIEARAEGLASALLGIAGWWLRNGEALTVDEVVQVFDDFVAGVRPKSDAEEPTG